MLRSVTAIIVNAAAGDDLHISALADIKVIIDQIMDAAVGQDDRDMHLLPGRARRDDDVNARLIALLTDLDIGGGVALHAHAVGAQIERGARHEAADARDLLQQALFHLIQHAHAPAFLLMPHGSKSMSSVGRISSRLPCAFTAPFSMTIISSASCMMRS